jgi:hypothetical protein
MSSRRRVFVPMKWTAAVLMATFSAPLPVQAEEVTVSEPRIALWDAATRDELVVVNPGRHVEVTVGSPVLLRVFQPDRARQQRHYLPFEVSVSAGRGVVELAEVDRQRGMVEIRALPGGAGRQATLAIQLASTVRVSDRGLRNLTVHVHAKASAEAPRAPAAHPAAHGAAPPPASRDEWIPMLYRGILLREPDPQGARHYQERLRTRGLPALIEAAQQMAGSPESMVEVPKRAQNTERLLALYRELFGLSSEGIDQAEWQRNLVRLDRGEYYQVVSEMVRSPAFAARHQGVRAVG